MKKDLSRRSSALRNRRGRGWPGQQRRQHDVADQGAMSLTRAQFIIQADAICEQGNAEVESKFEAFADENGIEEKEDPSKAQQVELSETILVRNVKNQAEEIRALGAPDEDEERVAAMLDSLDEGVEAVEADPQAPFTSISRIRSDPRTRSLVYEGDRHAALAAAAAAAAGDPAAGPGQLAWASRGPKTRKEPGCSSLET